jgi:hypothetical protein
MGQRIGEMKCLNPACSCTDVAVEVTGAGTWQSKCHKCGMPSFGKAGTKWRRDMEKLVTRDESDEPKPAPKAPAKVPDGSTLPEPKKPNPARPPMSAFNLADLS